MDDPHPHRLISDPPHHGLRDALLQTLFENWIDLVYVKDMHGRYLTINSAGARVFGRTVAEVLGCTDAELLGEGDAQKIRETDEMVMSSGRPYTFERRGMFPGQEYVFLTTKYPYLSDSGETLGTIGVSRDITDRVHAEEAERDQRAFSEALADTAAALNGTLRLDEVLDRILGSLARVVPHDVAVIFLIKDGIARVVRVLARNVEEREEILNVHYVIAETGNFRQIVETGQPLVITDVNAYASWVRHRPSARFQSLAGAPIRSKGSVIGFLNVYSDTLGFFQEAHGERLQAFADQAAIAIENARLYEHSEHLRVFNQNIVQSLEEGIVLEDAEGRVTFANPRCEEMLEVDAGGLLGKHAEDMVAAEDLPKVIEQTAKRVQGHASRYEIALRSQSGRRLPVIASARPMFENGQFSGVLSVFTDISERVHAEEALRESEERFSRMFHAAPLPMVIIGIESGLIVDANDNYLNLIGYTREETIGHSTLDLNLWVEPGERAAAVAQIHKEGGAYDRESKLRTKSGELRYINTSVAVVELSNGPHFIAVSPDITEQKRAEEALRRSEERFSKIFHAAPVPMSISRLKDGVYIDVNRSFVELTGYTREEAIDHNSLELKMWQNPEVREMLRRHFQTESANRELEVKIVHKSGELRDVRTSASLVELNGEAHFVGVSYDVTERKHIEEENARLFIATQRQLEELSILHAVARVGTEAMSEDDLFARVTHIIGERLYPDSFGVVLYDGTTATVHQHPSYQMAEDFDLERVFPASRGIVGRVVVTGKSRRAPDVTLDADYFAATPLTRSELCVPITLGERVIGAINVESRVPDAFREEDERFLITVAQQLATALNRLRAEAAERHRVQQLATIYDVGRRAASHLTLEEMLPDVVKRIRESMQFYHVSIGLVEGEQLVIRAGDGGYAGGALVGDHFRTQLGVGITGQVAATGETLLVRDVNDHPDYIQDDRLLNIRSELTVPLRVKAHVIGVLDISSDRVNGIRSSDAELLNILADQVAVAIVNAQLYTTVRNSEEQFRLLFDRAPNGMVMTGPDGRLLRVNQALCDLLGYTAKELLGTRFAEHTYADDLTQNLNLFEALMRGEMTSYRLEKRYIRKDGRLVHTIVETGVLYDAEGKPQYAIGHVVDITERKRAEARAREIGRRFKEMVAMLPVAVYECDADGVIQHYNRRAEELWGRTPQIGDSEERFCGSFRLYYSDGTFVPHSESPMAQVLRSGQPGRNLEIMIERPDGSRITVLVYPTPMRNDRGELIGAINCFQDITDRKRAEEALRESEERFRRLSDSSPTGIFQTDARGHATYVNPRWQEITGLSEAEGLGTGWERVLHPEDAAWVFEQWGNAIKHALEVELECRLIDPQQELKWIYVTAVPLVADDGNLRGHVGSVIDLTERKQAEEALRQAQKMESLGILAGGVAHDFNNLLVGILAQTSLAQGKLSPDSAVQRNLEKAVKAAERAADLTRQMLAYSGHGQFQIGPVHLNTLIEENLHLFKATVSKNVMLRSQLADHLPLIEADAGQMQQIVMNLILNAAEAIGDHPGAVTVITDTLILSADYADLWEYTGEPLSPGRYVTLRIRDDGSGMDEETLSKIFDPFFTTKFTGRGLGLAAVLGIVRGHKGGLRVRSQLGSGTTFELCFPASADRPDPSVQPQTLSPALRGCVLVIDDEESVRDAVKDILENEGLRVEVASSGLEGLQIYQEKFNQIDLVLLDLSMPGLSGAETLDRLQAIDPRANVLLSSGFSREEATRRFKGKRLAGFVQKPYSSKTLLDIVQRHIGLM